MFLLLLLIIHIGIVVDATEAMNEATNEAKFVAFVDIVVVIVIVICIIVYNCHYYLYQCL